MQIVRITPKNIFTRMNGISAIIALAEIFANKPDEAQVPNTAYIYFDVRNDTDSISANGGVLTRRARISMYVVGPKTVVSGTREGAIEDILNAIDQAILPETSDIYNFIDSLMILKIIDVIGGETPMGYTDKNRAIKAKDYDIIYYARS